MGELTAEMLRSQLNYDPASGVFTRKVASSNRIKVGDVCGSDGSHGYKTTWVAGKAYLLHRLAWLYVHGEWPSKYIDHINGDKTDNRIANLREATAEENGQNRHKANSNKVISKLTGVVFDSRYRRPWKSFIWLSRKRKYLGCYSTEEAAHAAYMAAKRALHPFSEIAKGAAS